MKSMLDQLMNKCIHFNGIFRNEKCKAGIKYNDVKVDSSPIKLPCLNQGGECPQCKFRTEEEALKEEEEINNYGAKMLVAYVQIKEQYKNDGKYSGTVTCQCGGEIKYAIAPVNDHIWAKCSTCGLNCIE